jgi:hypothetical protein
MRQHAWFLPCLRALGWHRLGAESDGEQLFALHDEVDDADDEPG